MTNEAFAELFTREQLRVFRPKVGTMGMAPMLEVRTPTAVAVFLLALDGFNDMDTRFAYLHQLGETCAANYPGVEVIRMGSEAWIKALTPEEYAARNGRLVETYDDKSEVVIVFGQLATGELMAARAPLFRRTTSGKIKAVGSWTIYNQAEVQRMRAPLLASFWDGYRQGKSTLN